MPAILEYGGTLGVERREHLFLKHISTVHNHYFVFLTSVLGYQEDVCALGVLCKVFENMHNMNGVQEEAMHGRRQCSQSKARTA